MSRDLKPGISIVIMAHERQEETIRALDAILKVDFGCETQIVVSDNPSSPENAIKNLPEGVIHRVRNPSGNSLWHLNQILQEANYEWTLLTHDDDEMLPQLGELFHEYSLNPQVMVITGKSRILINGIEREDAGYSSRLDQAGLNEGTPSFREDLFHQLFDIGPLFPASAIIARTHHLLKNSLINPDYNLASDLAYSMALARGAKVVFDGGHFVMNYHIHGGNSVFSVDAAGGLMSDFSIVKLEQAVENNIEITDARKKMLSHGVIASRILAKAYHLDSRYKNVRKYALTFNNHFSDRKISWVFLLPIPLGPFKIIVRRLMWKRLGVNRWGY
jgi:hypothetical protein